MKYYIFLINTLFTTVFYAQNKVDVYFDFNEIKVNVPSQKVFQDWHSENPNAEIYQIIGYCDTVGTNAYNKKLAKERIRTIEKLLKSNKIALTRDVQKVVVGEDFETSIDQAENRRVTFLYSTKEELKSYATSLKAAKKVDFAILTDFIRQLAEQWATNERQKAFQCLHDAHSQVAILSEGIHDHSRDQRANQTYRQVLEKEHRQDGCVVHFWLGQHDDHK